MSQISISAAFDSGNIIVEGGGGAHWDLAIRRDRMSDFYQWFHFRVTGAKGVPLTLRIVNAGQSAYPDGWPGYQARWSEDRADWRCAETDYRDGALTIRHTPASDAIWFAYHAPYSMERHHDLVARAARSPGVIAKVLGQTLDGQPMDMLSMGEDGPIVWLIARQHPGETMAEWWMEGAIECLIDPEDPIGQALRRRCRLRIVPNMNPDGSARGHLRTNAVGVNLNRVWHAPDPATEPEVACVLGEMIRTGVDFCMDVHGDESIPHVFMAGFEGIPGATNRQLDFYRRYLDRLAERTPDFQTRVGYEVAKPGQGNMTMSTNALAHRFGCVAMTLEMPFKDALELPEPVRGWSPGRSKALARACLGTLLEMLDQLR